MIPKGVQAAAASSGGVTLPVDTDPGAEDEQELARRGQWMFDLGGCR